MIGRDVALSCLLSGVQPMDAADALAVVVRGLRRHRKLSQEDLSSIDRSYLSRIERGEVNVTLDILIRLASILELDPAALVLMISSVQNDEAFSAGLKRASKQLGKIRKSGIALEIESLAVAGKLPPGRPARADAVEKAAEASRLKKAGIPVTEIAERLGLSVATIRRYIKVASAH